VTGSSIDSAGAVIGSTGIAVSMGGASGDVATASSAAAGLVILGDRAIFADVVATRSSSVLGDRGIQPSRAASGPAAPMGSEDLAEDPADIGDRPGRVSRAGHTSPADEAEEASDAARER